MLTIVFHLQAQASWRHSIKLFGTAITILFCTSAFAQLNKPVGTWINDDMEAIFIDSVRDENYLTNADFREEPFKLVIIKDTLSFQQRYTSSKTNFKVKYVDRYDFKVDQQSDSILVLRPVSEPSKNFFLGKEVLTFKKQETTVDKSIQFQKLVFHTTTCHGTCNAYHMELNNSRHFKLYAETVYDQDSFRTDSLDQGYFTGKVTDTLYHKLIAALQTSNLKTLRMKNEFCCDAPIITMIIYFNGQRKYFKSMSPPIVANNLINTLYEICKQNRGTKTNKKFMFEE
ncbi:DUF6438 domain-containing protein [Danxiaibacter flavus]|uniref:DUF6438 domain-containing protein n=1 Tax=Danxiaibacter flavus TaxID=3049108 RepID=A0ABV3ZM07_9BACT|nr:DUF6438 domain-containing protein [Chitinophagaceae bacterium DXS]